MFFMYICKKINIYDYSIVFFLFDNIDVSYDGC